LVLVVELNPGRGHRREVLDDPFRRTARYFLGRQAKPVLGLQCPRSPGERGRVRADHRVTRGCLGRGVGTAEQRVGGWRLGVRVVRNDAPRLARRIARADMAVGSGAIRVEQVIGSRQDRGDQQPPDGRVVVDLLGEERGELVGALRVADKDDSAAVVVVRQVVLPRGQHAVVGDLFGGGVIDVRQGDFPVHRGEDPAHPRERRSLQLGDGGLSRLDLEIGVRCRLKSDQGIHVKAVDGRMSRSLVIDDRLAAVCTDDRRAQRRRAWVMPESWAAEPDGSCGGPGRRGARAGTHARKTSNSQDPGGKATA
jgi:hypothetical protein